MSEFRVVELTRTNEKGDKGTFGFSVSGGTGTKLPVVVWEVSPGLPADLSKEVHVGDTLVSVNDRSTENMTPSDVVGMITSAPQISTFVFTSDENVQSRVKRHKARQAAGRPKKETVWPKKETVLTVEPSVNSDSHVSKLPGPSRGPSVKGSNREYKRSFVKHRSTTNKPRHRLSDGEAPLNYVTESPLATKHLSSSSLDPAKVGYDLSSGSISAKHRSISDSPRVGRESLPDLTKAWNDRSTSSKVGNEVSPKPQRTRNELSPDRRNHRVGKALSPELYRSGHNSDHWDSIASSQSESSVDILSGSCDSLNNTESPSVNSSSPSIRRGESSAIKVSSVDKKQVIRNLAVITSLDDEKGKEDFVKEKYSPCGPDAQIICSHDLDVSHDPTNVSHDLDVSHDPTNVSHDLTSVSHDLTSVDDSTSVSHDPNEDTPIGNYHSVSVGSDISSQSVHIEFLDSSLHSLEDIAEEPTQLSEIPTKKLHHMSIQSTSSVQSIGDVILPDVTTPNNAHHNAGVEQMTQIEIKHSKYGPHRYSNSIDDVETILPSTADHHSNSIGSDSSISNTRKLSASHLKVKRSESGRPLRTLDSREEAVVLARKLFMLDGFRRSQISGHLSDKSDFGQNVAEEYLKFFDFENVSLDQALRQFVCAFILSGETHEQERIIQHFSHRYHESNPNTFATADSCHSLICALLLLNTDLHAEHTGSRMTQSQFIANLQGTGEHYPKDLLKGLYESIKKTALPLAIDENVKETNSSTQNGTGNHSNSSKEPPTSVPVYHVTFPGTFIEVDLAGDAPVFKEGEIYRKNVMEGPNKKVPSGKRKWKPFYAYLKGFLLYFIEPQEELYLYKTSNALPVTHCIAQRAFDYHKRSSVLRVTTSDWRVFLFQAPSVTEMQQWMTAINKAAGTYSSIPLAAPIGSSSHFQRPMLPLAPTRLSQEEQIESHNGRIRSLEKELEEHKAYHSENVGRKAKSNQGSWNEKLEYLEFELTRYRIYVACMTSTSIEELQTPIPTSLIPSPSISTLATMHVDEMMFRPPDPPSPTLSTQSHSALSKHKKKRFPFK